ncbi:MAG: CotH kinase family protein [Planctomycetes bacterium]|nr:CotH kinase family protein [Planctomycetota bacterium]
MAHRGSSSRRWILGGAVAPIILLGIYAPKVAWGPGWDPGAVAPARGHADPEGRGALSAHAVAAADPPPPRGSDPAPSLEEQPPAKREEPGANAPGVPRSADAPGTDSRPDARGSREADRLFAELRVVAIEIEIPPVEAEALRGWHWQPGNGRRPEARATVREGGRVYSDVAVQLKGAKGSFRPFDDRPALTLKFDKHVPEQRFHGLRKLSLNNSVQDPSLLSERICRELFLEAGVPAPRAAHALVKLNGRELGVYVLVEGFNRQFLKRHFSKTSGNLFDCGFVQDVTEELTVNSGDDPQDHSALRRLVEAASEPDGELRLKRLEEVLDLERFLAFIALEAITGHWDGYAMNRNNYRVFHDLESGRLVFLPHGLDQVFGTGRRPASQSVIPRARGLVARAILEAPGGRERYLETFTRVYQKVFDPDRMVRRADEMAEPIRAALAEAHPERLERFLGRVRALKDAIRERGRSIEEQLSRPVEPHAASGYGTVAVTGWRARTHAGEPEVAEEEDAEGRRCLVIRAGPDSNVASWRAAVVLSPGRYRFEGRVRCQGVSGDDGAEPAGASLRIGELTPGRRLTGTRGWTFHSERFRVGWRDTSEVDLVCELRCEQGQVWFDKESLRVVRE